MKLIHNLRQLADRRRELRKKSTAAEMLLWNKLREKKLKYKFRRQYSIGGYILDFYCPKQRLIIELDGAIHKFRENYDRNRDRYFEELDYKVLHFKNTEVVNDLTAVVDKIKAEFSPSPKSRRGEGVRSV